MIGDLVERFYAVFKYLGYLMNGVFIYQTTYDLTFGVAKTEHWRAALSSLAILSIGCLLLGIYCLLKKLAEAKVAIDEASSFDYKFCADRESSSVKRLMERLNVSLDSIDSKTPVAIAPEDARFLSIEDFFSGTNGDFAADFRCMPIKSKDKLGKVILQVSFVPMDCNGNTPLILRMPDQHSSARVEKPEFTFVSFSPVPRRYKLDFNLLDCYNREVGSRPSAFAKIGMYVSRVDKKDKKTKRVIGSIYYVFWVFAAKYAEVSFCKPDGSLDIDACEKTFASSSGTKGLMFTKDHDEILYALQVRELSSVISGNALRGDKRLAEVLGNRRFVIMRPARNGTGKPKCMSFDMTRARMKGVESRIAKDLSTCADVASAFVWNPVNESDKGVGQ